MLVPRPILSLSVLDLRNVRIRFYGLSFSCHDSLGPWMTSVLCGEVLVKNNKFSVLCSEVRASVR